MRILVLATAASTGGAMSILRSLWEFAASEHASDHEWDFVLSDRHLRECDRVRVHIEADPKRSWSRRLRFELLTGSDLVQRHDADIVLTLQNTVPRGIKVPTVVYLHQTLPFEANAKYRLTRKAERQMAIYQKGVGRLIKSSVARSDLTVVQTNWMKEVVCDQVGLASDRIVVIPPQLIDAKAFANTYAHDSRRFVYPTSETVHKNNELLLSSCRRLFDLGFTDVEVVLTLDREERIPLASFSGRLKHVELLRLMSCSTLVFPSTSESYGLPLAEARAIGGMVLAADLPYAREVLAGYGNAYFFDPNNYEELTQLMASVRLGVLLPVSESGEWADVDRGSTGWSVLVKRMEQLVEASAL